jgi:hypothetical protein
MSPLFLIVTVLTALPYVAAIAASYLLWHGLRAAGVSLKPSVLIVLALLVLSPLLAGPVRVLRVLSYQLHMPYLDLFVPMFLACVVGFALYRALRLAGLGLNKAVWYGIGAGMVLVVAVGAYFLAEVAAIHALGG